MSGPVYDVVLVAHIVAAIVGFGALAAAGFAASSARRSPDPVREESVRRFFKAGRDWPARVIFLVPVLGLGLLFGGDRPAEHDPWPWVGLALWTLTAAVATAVSWPAEARAQRAFARLVASARLAPSVPPQGKAPEPLPPAPAGDGALLDEFRAACRRMEAAGGVISLCFLAAAVIMIWQPS